MKKASEYREHAEECRALARTMPETHQRERLLQMAAMWEEMAVWRERKGPEQEDESAAALSTASGI